MYASRLAQVEYGTGPNSTPDSDDEHQLIAQYCQALPPNGSGPKSPVQVMAAMDAEQREELEAIIRDLEEENANLQSEYQQLSTKQTQSLTTPDEGTNHSPLGGLSLGSDADQGQVKRVCNNNWELSIQFKFLFKGYDGRSKVVTAT